MFYNLFTQKNWVFNADNISAAYPHINPENVKEVEIWSNCLYVTFLTGSPRFLSKKKVLEAFFEERENESRKVNTPIWCDTQKMYAIRSRSKQYKQFYTTETQCDCHDFQIQKQIGITNPTCSHMYKVKMSNAARQAYLDRVKLQYPDIENQIKNLGFDPKTIRFKDLQFIITDISLPLDSNAA